MADEQALRDDAELVQGDPKLESAEIEYTGLDDAFGVFSDVAVITHQQDIFSLYFFQLQVPGFKAGPNESLESTRAQAKCVARIILTPERMLALHQAVGRNLQRFKDKLMATQQTTPEPDTEKSQ